LAWFDGLQLTSDEADINDVWTERHGEVDAGTVKSAKCGLASTGGTRMTRRIGASAMRSRYAPMW